jgi:predicted AAA+ superfamily ATPase
MDERLLHEALEGGGLPGICFARNAAHRASRFKTHLDTLLDRDLRLVLETTLPKNSLLALTRALASAQGQPLHWEGLRRDSGISVITLKKLFSAFEALFLLRPVCQVGRATPDTYWFEDLGLARHLSGMTGAKVTLREITHFLFCHLREPFHHSQDLPYEIESYRTRGGAYVPLVFRTGTRLTGIIPVLETQPTPSSLRSAQSFLKQHPAGKALVVHCGSEPRTIHSKLLSIPWNWLI